MICADSPPPFSYRQDPAVPDFDDGRPLIVFDGQCALCSWSARFVLRHDRSGRFRLTAAQSSVGEALYRHYALKPGDYATNLLLINGAVFGKSDGAIKVLEMLGAPWAGAVMLRVIPRGWRDRVYDIVARNRLRWFGARTVCFVPDAKHRNRFLS